MKSKARALPWTRWGHRPQTPLARKFAAKSGGVDMRVVLDTDVVVAAFASAAGASRRLLLAALDGELRILLSTALLLEYEAVLTRREILALAGVTTEEVLAVLDALARICTPVAFDFRIRPGARDPDDDHVLETAINGGAEAIVTFNLADMREGAARFGIPVERPGAVLKRILQ